MNDIPKEEPAVLPSWLTIFPKTSSKTKELLELVEMQFGNIFENVMINVSSGVPVTKTLALDNRNFDSGHFLRWIKKDPIRNAIYKEAKEIGTEIIVSEIIEISDGTNSFEDVQRSTLRVNSRKWLASVWNRKEYGDVRQIEHSGSISIIQAMQDAQSRVDSMEQPIDAEWENVD